jgi:large conductance mechanosensitive channel
MGLATEFRDFIAGGNVVDLAVGVLIGGAFGKLISSLVDNVIMPVVGLFLGGADFSSLKIILKAADPITKSAEVAVSYGVFINTVVQFLILMAVVFAMVKSINQMRKPAVVAEAGPPAPSAEETLLGEIRDLLKTRG